MSVAPTIALVPEPSATVDAATLSPVDPGLLGVIAKVLRPAVKGYHRAEVQGIDNVPEGGALLVSNHSGGIMAMDVPVIAVAFWDEFGLERPLRILAHDMLMAGPWGTFFKKAGMISASRANAAAALAAGEVTVVFPGGDWDAYRPTALATKIDFGGRTGYVRTAVETGVPIVPVVSLGGQETQYIFTRGEWFGRVSPLRKVLRSELAPITLGFPFGFTIAGLPNLPLPSKIVTRVLEPIDIAAEFGPDPDVAEVDREVRRRMQTAIDELAAERRFPVIG